MIQLTITHITKITTHATLNYPGWELLLICAAFSFALFELDIFG